MTAEDLIDEFHDRRWGPDREDCSAKTWMREFAAALADAPAGLDVEGLAVAMNTAQVTCDEIRLGRDLRVPAARIARAYRGAR